MTHAYMHNTTHTMTRTHIMTHTNTHNHTHAHTRTHTHARIDIQANTLLLTCDCCVGTWLQLIRDEKKFKDVSELTKVFRLHDKENWACLPSNTRGDSQPRAYSDFLTRAVFGFRVLLFVLSPFSTRLAPFSCKLFQASIQNAQRTKHAWQANQ